MQAADDLGRRVLPPDLARILHDLRGPLNSLTMHLEVLKRTASGDTGAEESLRTALQQLGRLAEMIPAALAVTSLELGPVRPVDLGVLAARVRDAEAAGTVTIAAGSWPSAVASTALRSRCGTGDRDCARPTPGCSSSSCSPPSPDIGAWGW